jgi:hypothetical protein
LTSQRTGSIAAMVVLVFAGIVLHGDALNGWWLYDDPQLILHAIDVPSLATLFDPAAYRQLATHTFTPLLPISFKLDLAMSGLSPRFFYAHQVAAVIVSALLLFVVLRRRIALSYAFAGAMLWLACWPALYAARTLMIRHYVEGLCLALAALALFDLRRRSADIAAALLYLAAMLEKEIYVPLIVVFWLACTGESFRRRVGRLIPSFAALLIFALWRTIMLGSGGGYAGEVNLRAIARLPLTVAHELFPESIAAFLLFFLPLAVLALLSLREKGVARSTAALALLAAALLPIGPVAAMFEWRFLVGPAVVLVTLFAIAADRAQLPSPLKLALVTMTLVTVVSMTTRWSESYRSVNEPAVAEGKWLWSANLDAATLVGRSVSWYLDGIKTLRLRAHRGAAPTFVASREGFIVSALDPRRAVEYDATRRSFVPLHDAAALLVERTRRDFSLGLDVSIERKADTLLWHFASRAPVEWIFISPPSFQAYPVGAEGSRRIPRAKERQSFQIRARMSDGRWNATPVLPLPFEGETTSWSSPIAIAQ